MDSDYTDIAFCILMYFFFCLVPALLYLVVLLRPMETEKLLRNLPLSSQRFQPTHSGAACLTYEHIQLWRDDGSPFVSLLPLLDVLKTQFGGWKRPKLRWPWKKETNNGKDLALPNTDGGKTDTIKTFSSITSSSGPVPPYFSSPHASTAQLNPPSSASHPYAPNASEQNTTPSKADHVRIIKDVSGFAKPGTLNAIMGPSGCGKTTLLDVLALRHPSDNISGQVQINAKTRNQRYMKRTTAYVLQNDVLFENLTVKETLMFTVELRLQRKITVDEKVKRVEQVMRDLDLIHVANRRVSMGDRGGGLSGGQKRRLTIAIELVTFPSILFLDEPTLGLDAYSSLKLVQTLKRLAEKNRTIICAISQPSADIFELFDTLLLLKEGGVAYFGPTTEIPWYFLEQNFTLPDDTNIADLVVDLTYTKEEDENELEQEEHLWTHDEFLMSHRLQEKKTVKHLTSTYKKSKLCKDMDDEIKHLSNQTYEEDYWKDIIKDNGETVRYPITIRRQVYVLARRSIVDMKRNIGAFYSSWGLSAASILAYGFFYLGLITNSTSNSDPTSFLHSQQAFLFQVMTGVCLSELGVLAQAYLESRIFFRENASGSYSTISYHLGWFIKLYFFAVVKGLFYSILCYFLAGMNSSFDRFIYFAANLSVLSNIGSSIALLLITAIKDVDGAASAYTSAVGTMATFCGFFFLPNYTPALFKGTYYTSWYKYALEGLYWNEFEGTTVTYNVSVNSTLSVFPWLVTNISSGWNTSSSPGLFSPWISNTTASSVISNTTNSTMDWFNNNDSIIHVTPISNTTLQVVSSVLLSLDIDHSLNRYTNLIVLMIYPLGFHVLSYIASALHVGVRQRHSKFRHFLSYFRPRTRRKIGDLSVMMNREESDIGAGVDGIIATHKLKIQGQQPTDRYSPEL